MSDVKLTVGIQEQLSFDNFDAGIRNVINRINRQKYNIKVDLSDESLKNFRNQIDDTVRAIKSIGSVGTFDKKALSSMSSEFKNATKEAERLKAVLAKDSANESGSIKSIEKKQAEYKAAYDRLVKGIAKGTATSDDISNTVRLKSELDQLVESIRARIEVEKQASTYSMKSFNAAKSGLKTLCDEYEKATKKAESLKVAIKDSNPDDYSKVNSKQTEYNSAYNKLINSASTGVVTAEEIANVARLRSELDLLVSSIEAKSNAEAKSAADSEKNVMSAKQIADNMVKVNALISTIKSHQEKWTAAAHGNTKGAYDSYDNYIQSLEELLLKLDKGALTVKEFADEFSEIKKKVSDSDSVIKSAGKNVKSFGDRFKDITGRLGSWISVERMFRMAEQTMRKMFNAVVDIDAAMTELKKVTDETDSEYSKFLDNATVRARSLGATLKDTINASADMARLGYNIQEASNLADSAIVYKNVGDGIENIDEASSSIISTMQAFNIEAKNSMQIVDKFNKAGNEFAISSGGVGDALLNSASALAAAGNNIDESIGLITAANEVVQDPQKVGTTLKTVSMFLRAAKTDAEAAGESTEGMADSISKLRTEILQLTGGRVDIQLDANTFKSTTQILRELSQVWDSLSDITQANILERVGGKRNANVVAALINNFETVDEVIEATSNSTGSALAENEKYLDSINGKIAQFKATFEALSMSVVDSGLVKLVVDVGTIGINVINGLASGIKNIFELISKMPGVNIIAPLLTAYKAFPKILSYFNKTPKDIFDWLKNIPDIFSGKVYNLAIKLGEVLFEIEDAGGGLSGVVSLLTQKFSKFLSLPIGKFSAAIAAISLLSHIFNQLASVADKSREEFGNTASELGDTKSKIEELNSELETTRLRVLELLNKDSLTFTEQEELERLKQSNSELEKEIQLLEQRYEILSRENENSFIKTAKNSTDGSLSYFAAIKSLGFEDVLEYAINQMRMHGSTKENLKNGYGFYDTFNDYGNATALTVLSERLNWYDKETRKYNKARDNLYNSTSEFDKNRFERRMNSAQEELTETEKYILEYKSQLESDLSLLGDYEYGTNDKVDEYIDLYNDAIDKINIRFGFDGAADNAFTRNITQTFDEVTDKYEELGKEGKVTAEALDKAYKASDDTEKGFKAFIDNLVEIGYISDATPESLAKVARAFNKLGDEAQNSSDSVEDAFKRWEDAQNEVQSGARFDTIIDAINHVHDTVTDRTADIYGKIGNSDYKAAIDLLIPIDANVDETKLANVSKYIKDNIKKYFTFDDDGNYKGFNINRFLEESKKAGIMEFDKNSGIYSILSGVSVEKWAKELGVAIPLLKAMIGEVNEYGGNIQILELDEDLETLAKNAKSAISSLKNTFEDFDVDLDLTGKTNVEKIEYLDGLITELTEKRKAEGVDTTSYNNLTKVMEHCIKQKQILEQPAVMYVDTTQLTDENTIAQIEKIQNFVNAHHEFELLAKLGYETEDAEKNLEKTIIDLSEDTELSTKFKIDPKSTDSISEQLYSQVNGVVDGFNIPKEAFKPALDAVSTLANNINEIFSGKRDLVFNITGNAKEGFRISVDSQELEDAKESKEDVEKPSFISILLSQITRSNMAKIESYQSLLETITKTKWKTNLEVNTTLNNGSTETSGSSNSIKNWLSNVFGGGASVSGTANAGGNWSYDGGESLIGELGRELIVDPKTGTWYTVGDHGAEFVDVPKGSIIFNHKQTKSLLENGRINGRGKAYVSGKNNNTIPGTMPIVVTGNSYLDKKLSPSVSQVTINVTNNKTGLVDLSDVIKGSDIKNITTTGDTSDQAIGQAPKVDPYPIVNTSGSTDKDKNTVDWVEIALSRLSRSLENFAKTADDTAKTFNNRAKAISNQINKTNELITANEKAADAYLAKANSVKLSSDLKKKVRNGDYSISNYDSKTADLINEYKDYYEKYLAAKDEISTQKSNKSALVMDQFGLIQSKYDSQYGLQDSRLDYQDALNEKYELLDQGGSLASQNNSIEIYENRLSLLKEEQDEYKNLLNSGAVKKNTEDWYKLKEAIANNNAEMLKTENTIKELNQKKIEIQFERFENTKENFENQISIKDNAISYYEANNQKHELKGNGGSIYAQEKIIGLYGEKLDLLKQEKTELEKQLKKIPKETEEWYKAKGELQGVNKELAETNNNILEANKNIDDINFERFGNISEAYDKKNLKAEGAIKKWEDINTQYELNGEHGSLHAQDKLIEWNTNLLESKKKELADMEADFAKMDKSNEHYAEAEKAIRDTRDQIRDYENQNLQYEKNKIDILYSRYQDIDTLYGKRIAELDHNLSSITNQISILESNGYKASSAYYEAQKKIEQDRVPILIQQLEDMKKAFSKAIEVGDIKEGTLEWYKWQEAINNCEQSIANTEVTIANLNKSMRDLEWEKFEYARDAVSRLNNEADFYIELMSSKDMYDDNGKITDEGMATLGLLGQKYNTYMEEAAANTEKLAEIESKLADDPYNEELISKKNELTDAIYDNVLAANKEKDAIRDLVEDGINYELDALKELIDKYTESLDKAKDLHDYEKKIAKETSDIASIRKQISAYSGDDSQESKLRIQKLQNELKEAEENLEETEYDRYVSDQKDLLDEFYEDYESLLTEKLNDVEEVVKGVTSAINGNAETINKTLEGISSSFGVEMSNSLTKIWGSGSASDILKSFIGDDTSGIIGKQTTINSALNSIERDVEAIYNAKTPTGNVEQNTSVVDEATSTDGSGGKMPGIISNLLDKFKPYKDAEVDNNSQESKYAVDDIISVNDEYMSIYSSPSGSKITSSFKGGGGSKYRITDVNGDWLGLVPDAPSTKNKTSAVYWIKSSENDINKYKNGGLVDYTGLAWVDGTKSNPEYMLNAKQTEAFTNLYDNIQRLYNNGEISATGIANNLVVEALNDISKSIGDISHNMTSGETSIGDINITIPIDRVQDYNDFVGQLKNDPKFERLVQTLSIDLLSGKSRLAKNKINWNK